MELRFGKTVNFSDYKALIDRFAQTKTNSVKTSSVPFVQFWKDTESRLDKLLKTLKIECDNPVMCFEHPTPSKGRGKSSMTDLMIITNDKKIAIEAKYTEYHKVNVKKSAIIGNWVQAEHSENRAIVLDHWSNIISRFSNNLNEDLLDEIEYQFYHRTASACYEAENSFVLYQLFYDIEHKEDLQCYINKIRKYIVCINPSAKLNFYLWLIETKRHVDVSNEPFILMRNQDIYSFGKDEIIKL